MSIDHPPFPPLTLATWNNEGGELNGNGFFPYWATLQSTVTSSLCADSGDGSLYITVNTPANEHDRPTIEQVAAFQHLMANGESVFSAILEAVFDEYDWMREDFAESMSVEKASKLAPDLAEPFELLPLLTLVTMTVHRVFKDAMAYVGLSFGCTWDEEHGVGVLIHGTRIVSVGGCDTSFLEWIPESDVAKDA